jgi:hypothetical protein
MIAGVSSKSTSDAQQAIVIVPWKESCDSSLLGLDDMLLLHHYTATTYAVLDTCSNSGMQRLWQDNVVRIGLQHPFLLRGILAVSAAHLAYLSPSKKSKYLLQSSQHVDIALQEFQSQLLHLEESSVLPLFPLACLLVVQTYSFVNLQDTSDHIEAFLSCVQLVKGVSTVLSARWDIFEHCELSPLISAGIMQDKDVAASEFAPLCDTVRRCMQEASDIDRLACLTAVHHLQFVFNGVQECVQDKSALAILLTWPLKLPPRFIEMISERHPFALIILAHVVVILQSVGQVWWLTAWDAKLLEAVIAYVDDDYRMWLAWPMRCIRNHKTAAFSSNHGLPTGSYSPILSHQ